MSGLSTILNTDNYEKITYRPTPFRPYRINVGERGGKYGISGLRDARLKPIDVLYRETRVSNTPRLGEQLPSLPDRRQGFTPNPDKSVMTGATVDMEDTLVGGFVGPRPPSEEQIKTAKNAVATWLKIFEQMNPAEKKVVSKQHGMIKKISKMIGRLPKSALMRLINAKAMKFLLKKHGEMKGGAHCSCGCGQCGGSLWADIKKTAGKVAKGVKKGIKKTGKFVSKVGEKVEKGAEKVAEVAGKVGKVVSTAAEVGTLVTAVIPGLQELTPILAGVAAAAEGVEKLGKEVAKHSKTAKEVGKKMSGEGLSLPTREGVTPGPRSTDRLSFVATHPMNYRKAIL